MLSLVKAAMVCKPRAYHFEAIIDDYIFPPKQGRSYLLRRLNTLNNIILL
jgi:hypothetical protein